MHPHHRTTVPIIDSGCTNHFLRSDAPVVAKDDTSSPITAGTPNGATITSSCSALLADATTPLHARTAHLFPGLTNLSLLSVGQFCDAGYTCIFAPTTVEMMHPSSATVVGHRDLPSGMYLVNLSRLTATSTTTPLPASPLANSVYTMRTKVNLATYLHLCAWSPVVHT